MIRIQSLGPPRDRKNVDNIYIWGCFTFEWKESQATAKYYFINYTLSIKLAFWSVSKDFLKLSMRNPDSAESGTNAVASSCSSLAPESRLLCLLLPLPLAGEQNRRCAALGGTMGLIHGLGKRGIVAKQTLALLFAGDTATFRWKHLVWILPATG